MHGISVCLHVLLEMMSILKVMCVPEITGGLGIIEIGDDV